MQPRRRSVISAAAWSLPAVAVASASPAYATSRDDGLPLAVFTVNFPVTQASGADEIWGTATSDTTAITYQVRLSTTLGADTATVGTGLFNSNGGVNLYTSGNQNLRSYAVVWSGTSDTSQDFQRDVRYPFSYDATNPTVMFNHRARVITEPTLGFANLSIKLPPEEERVPASAELPSQTVTFSFLDSEGAAVPSVQDMSFTIAHMTVATDPALGWRQRSWPSIGFSPAPVSVTSQRAEGPFLAGTGSLADPIRRTAEAEGMADAGWRDAIAFSRFPTGGTMRLREHGDGQGWLRLGLSHLTFAAPS